VATNVEVPSVGESVTEAILVKWHKPAGAKVSRDEPLCELETDKANVDVPAPGDGYLKHVAEEGATVGVGEVIAELQETGEGLPQAEQGGGAESGASAPSKEEGSGKANGEARQGEASGGGSAPASAPGAGDLRPAVRNLVAEHGLDPSKIEATGPGGVLTKEDVQRHIEEAGAARQREARAPAKEPPRERVQVEWTGQERREPMSKLRRRIATRLVAAQQETAMLTTFNEVDLGEVKAIRARYKEEFQKIHGIKLGFMSFFARAVTQALQEFPAVNGKIDGDDVVYHDYVNLGIAVSTPRGLVVPVIKHVEKLSLGQIESEIKRVATAARDGKLALDEMSGGTFTVTNGGVFGSMMSTPILNRPQSGILGMHAIQDRPVARDGEVVIRPMMYLALSYDHRIIDGRESVSFLVRVKESLEDPARMLLQI